MELKHNNGIFLPLNTARFGEEVVKIVHLDAVVLVVVLLTFCEFDDLCIFERAELMPRIYGLM